MNLVQPYIKLLVLLAALFACAGARAQRVCEESKREVSLGDGVKVYLFREVPGVGVNSLYYLPASLQLSEDKGVAECSYQEYSQQGSLDPDGAILHLLVTWGLTTQQIQLLTAKAKEHYGGDAVVAGALYLDPESPEAMISDKTAPGKILNASLTSKGSPPTMSSGKMAFSFHIKKEQVKTMSEAFKSPAKLGGTTLSLSYRYTTYRCNEGTVPQENRIILTGDLKQWLL